MHNGRLALIHLLFCFYQDEAFRNLHHFVFTTLCPAVLQQGSPPASDEADESSNKAVDLLAK